MGWFVYMLRCGDGTLYTGIATDVTRRTRQHEAGKGARYTRGRGPLALVHAEMHEDRGSALRREAALKSLTRRQKEKLIARTIAEADVTSPERRPCSGR